MSPKFTKTICIAAVLSLSGSAIFMTGCEGLDFSARSEGTGVQVIGAIVVLAKYKANAHQKAVAMENAHAALVAAAKPVYEKRRILVRDEAKKKIAAAERQYARNHELKQATVAKIEAEKAAQIAKLDVEEKSPAVQPRPIPNADQFIAVKVPPQHVPEEEGGKATYMLYDTHRQQLASDDVFVLSRDPRDRSVVKVNGISARVAGNP
jgi:hypothetical protein